MGLLYKKLVIEIYEEELNIIRKAVKKDLLTRIKEVKTQMEIWDAQKSMEALEKLYEAREKK